MNYISGEKEQIEVDEHGHSWVSYASVGGIGKEAQCRVCSAERDSGGTIRSSAEAYLWRGGEPKIAEKHREISRRKAYPCDPDAQR